MRFTTVLALVLSLAACGSSSSGIPQSLSRSVEGVVYVTGPVTGATVFVYALDLPTGAPGALLAESTPTAEDGRFSIHLDTKVTGAVLFVAKGAGVASYAEPSTGGSVVFDSLAKLRGTLVERDPAEDFRFDVSAGDVPLVVLSPWTELAMEYAAARHRHQLSPTFAHALATSFALFSDHLEHEFWNTEPDFLAHHIALEPVPSFLGSIELLGLSEVARRIAVDSRTSGTPVDSLALLSALVRDIADPRAQFDGEDVRGSLRVGTCDTICALSGNTLRAHFAEGIAGALQGAPSPSGVTLAEMRPTLARIASRGSELFAAPGATDFDTTPPRIVIQGLRIAEILTGDHTATVTVTDNIEMGTVSIALVRNDVESTAQEFLSTSLQDNSTDTKHIVALTLHSAALPDGSLSVRMYATDAAGNAAPPLDLSVFTDNQPSTTLSGVVWAGGPVGGAIVEVWEYDDAQKGALLGATTTAVDGAYAVDLRDSSATVVLATARGAGDGSSYDDAATGQAVPFAQRETLSTVLTDLRPSASRQDGMITLYTTVAVAYAHRAHAYLGMYWPYAVSKAFGALEAHFDAPGQSFHFRDTAPASLSTAQAGGATSELAYGLALAGWSELARTLGAELRTTLSPYTLMEVLREDIGGDDGAPVLDGRGAAPLFVAQGHPVTSYLTRVDLAHAMATFVAQSPYHRSSLRLADLTALLERVSGDDGSRGPSWPPLYPIEDRPRPYDTEPPAPITFVSPTPEDGTILRGRLLLSAEAVDNRALASFAWTEPSVLDHILLDSSAGKDAIWVLTGGVNTDLFAEGDLHVVARAQDEAGLTTDGRRTFVIDRTDPAIVVLPAQVQGASLLTPRPINDGEWTDGSLLAANGTVSDRHLDVADFAWNGARPALLSVDAQSAWALTDLTLLEGTNTLTLQAVDKAGNTATATVFYHRDSIDPIVSIDQALAGDVVVSPDSWTSATSLKVSGTVEEANLAEAVYSYGAGDTPLTSPASLPEPSKWTVTVPLEQEKNTFVVRARDKAGNSHFASAVYYCDSRAPIVTIDKAVADGVGLLPNAWTGAPLISIAGTAVDAHLASVTGRWDGGAAVPLPQSVLGRWKLTDLPLVAGANTLVVSATDLAGNTTTVEVTYFRDAEAPTVQILSTSMEDEATWTIAISPDVPGTVTYKKPSITLFALLGGASATFTKFASNYGPRSTNLPEVRFFVSDNKTPSETVTFEAGLLRRNFATNSWDTLVPESSPIGYANGTDYNRSILLSSAYHPELALRTGLYRLIVRARDAYGNASAPQTVSWQQSLRNPPIRQRQGGTCPSISPQCPAYYGLADYQNNAADLMYGGGDLEPSGNKVTVAESYIDNPNDVPVRVDLVATSTRSWTWATRYFPYAAQTYTRAAGVTEYPDWSCGTKDVTPDGTCYTFTPRADSFFGSGKFIGLSPSVTVGGTPLATCSGCSPTEYELPPKTTARVRYLAGPYSPIQLAFLVQTLDSARDYTMPALTAVDTGFDWLRCTKSEGGGITGAATFCTRWVRYREYLALTSASLTPEVRITAQARPASFEAGFTIAEGVAVKDFVPTLSSWITSEDTPTPF